MPEAALFAEGRERYPLLLSVKAMGWSICRLTRIVGSDGAVGPRAGSVAKELLMKQRSNSGCTSAQSA
jgi:hypothetical protein